jgi:hypothetical protein
MLGLGNLPNGGDDKEKLKALIVAGLLFDKVKEAGLICSFIRSLPPKEWERMLCLDEIEFATEIDKIIKDFHSTMMARRNPVGGSLEGDGMNLSHCFATIDILDDPR